jgi:fatty acid desaturase
MGINLCLAILSKELVERAKKYKETKKVPSYIYLVTMAPYLYTMVIMANLYGYFAGLFSAIIYRKAYDKRSDTHLFFKLNLLAAITLMITFIPIYILIVVHRIYVTFRYQS